MYDFENSEKKEQPEGGLKLVSYFMDGTLQATRYIAVHRLRAGEGVEGAPRSFRPCRPAHCSATAMRHSSLKRNLRELFLLLKESDRFYNVREGRRHIQLVAQIREIVIKCKALRQNNFVKVNHLEHPQHTWVKSFISASLQLLDAHCVHRSMFVTAGHTSDEVIKVMCSLVPAAVCTRCVFHISPTHRSLKGGTQWNREGRPIRCSALTDSCCLFDGLQVKAACFVR